jgi:hypothetical protein
MMIPTLSFLLALLLLGGVIRTYLRQEQNRLIQPRDKYDEAWNEAFGKRQKNNAWNGHFEAVLVSVNSSSISLGLGLLSCATLLLNLEELVLYDILIAGIGSLAALAGLCMGIFGVFHVRNESAFIRYSGVLLSIAGFMNIIHLGSYLLIGTFFAWLILSSSSG